MALWCVNKQMIQSQTCGEDPRKSPRIIYSFTNLCIVFYVGMTGFEPATSSSRTKNATKLHYIPKYRLVYIVLYSQNKPVKSSR